MRKAWMTFALALLATFASRALAQELAAAPAAAAGAEDEKPSPAAIYVVNPEFPVSHKKKTEQGQIVLRATVGADGAVKGVSIVAGKPALAELAAAAVRKWRYVPALKAGHFTASEKEISIIYRLGRNVSIPGEPVSPVPRAPKEDLTLEIDSGTLYQGKKEGVVPPKALSTPDPEYSELARTDKFQGSLTLGLVVGNDGNPLDIWVVCPLGHGLDERALDVVKSWKFAPATRNGNPVPDLITVEVSFHVSGGREPQFEYGAAPAWGPYL